MTPINLLFLVHKTFAYLLIGARNAAWHDVARGCDRRLLGSRNVAMQRRAGPWLLGRGGVARCPKGFSGRRPPPTRTGVGTPRLGAVSGVPSGSHPLLLRDPLGSRARNPGSLYTCLCACWCGGWGEIVSFEFP